MKKEKEKRIQNWTTERTAAVITTVRSSCAIFAILFCFDLNYSWQFHLIE